MSDTKDLSNQPSPFEPLLLALRRLADACTHDDKLMTASPWKYSAADSEIHTEDNRPIVTSGSVGYVNAWLNISDEDAVAIVATRNRLPELARILRDVAARVDLLENLAIQHGAARDRLRDRVDALEDAIQKACKSIEEGPWSIVGQLEASSDYRKVRDVLASLRSALLQTEPST